MKRYCYVENNEVKKGPCELPKNTENVSNLNVLDNVTLKLYGWLPCRTINGDKPVIVGSKFEITDDEVIETIITRDKTEEETVADRQIEITEKWREIREQRDLLLFKTDKNVVSDKWEIMDLNAKTKISLYRQQLRDIPQIFSDPFTVTFPTLEE